MQLYHLLFQPSIERGEPAQRIQLEPIRKLRKLPLDLVQRRPKVRLKQVFG